MLPTTRVMLLVWRELLWVFKHHAHVALHSTADTNYNTQDSTDKLSIIWCVIVRLGIACWLLLLIDVVRVLLLLHVILTDDSQLPDPKTTKILIGEVSLINSTVIKKFLEKYLTPVCIKGRP